MTFVSVGVDFYTNVLPLFYHFKDDITDHIIIYDNFKQDTLQAKKIIDGTKAFISKYNLPIVTHTKKIDEDSYLKLEALSEYILEFQKNNNSVSINITDCKPPQEKLPITDATQQRNIINVHLQKLFELEIDFFNRMHLSKVLNFKVNYSKNKKVQQNMKNQDIKQLLRLMNRLKETRDIQYLYNYFCKKVQ